MFYVYIDQTGAEDSATIFLLELVCSHFQASMTFRKIPRSESVGAC